jgi:hypothetical protein
MNDATPTTPKTEKEKYMEWLSEAKKKGLKGIHFSGDPFSKTNATYRESQGLPPITKEELTEVQEKLYKQVNNIINDIEEGKCTPLPPNL